MGFRRMGRPGLRGTAARTAVVVGTANAVTCTVRPASGGAAARSAGSAARTGRSPLPRRHRPRRLPLRPTT
ncbi:conserved exported protein of unknown function [Micropruina glycogenica]|uniref:Uncharacterized protein n=1 Tax=Micropruina glycogenica TaxID=75385 RepID=A0A2N9JG61_9ACTN|nr:conserved exported protein of unknown function [Micropruina glycogenica]